MTDIEWTHRDGTRGETWNPVTGCDRISPGCDHCYALTMAKRLKAIGSSRYQHDGDPRTSGPGFGVTVHPDALDIPLRWRTPRTVFVNSMSDLFHARVPATFVADVFAVMAATRRHTYQVLTKRPERMSLIVGAPGFRAASAPWRAVGEGVVAEPEWPLPGVWLGTSVESADYVRRIDALRKTPAAVRFLSLEPLLGQLPDLDLAGIHWVIVGGESGPGARPMNLGWVRDIIAQCRAVNVPVFVKQLGSRAGFPGKGGDPSLWPNSLRVREYPQVPAVAQ